MCSRFELKRPVGDVFVRFGLANFGLRAPPPWPNRDEVRPTDAALVIGPCGAARLLHWGLAVPWDKGPLINARAETLAERPSFSRLLRARVLVPATAWWEWRKNADGKTRTKMRLSLADGGLFCFAGLVEGGHFTIVTCDAAPGIAAVHARMPVVLAPQAEAAWIDPARPFTQVAGALRPTAFALTARPDSSPATKPAQGDLFG